MPRSARNRERRPGRRPAFREPRRRILVVCEGVVTEPQYLNGLARHFRNQLVDVKIIPGGAVPLTLVKSARDLKKEADGAAKRERDVNLKYDDVWCVFDLALQRMINLTGPDAAKRYSKYPEGVRALSRGFEAQPRTPGCGDESKMQSTPTGL